jgi:hypothetical protein
MQTALMLARLVLNAPATREYTPTQHIQKQNKQTRKNLEHHHHFSSSFFIFYFVTRDRLFFI